MAQSKLDKRILETIAWLMSGALAVAFFAVASPIDDARLWRAILNASHAPFFAVTVAAIMRLSILWIGARVSMPIHFAISGLLAVFLGGASEFAQYFLPRDASLKDLVRDLIGIASGLLFCWAVLRSGHRLQRSCAILAAIGLLGITAWPVVTLGSAYHDRARVFPELAVLPPGAAHVFHELSDATAQYGRNGITVTFLSGSGNYPRFEILGVEPSWKRSTGLVATIENHSTKAVALNLRIHDSGHSGAYADRFNTDFSLEPGPNRIYFSMEQIENGPENRRMDLDAVSTVIFFVIRPSSDVSLTFSSVRLVGDLGQLSSAPEPSIVREHPPT